MVKDMRVAEPPKRPKYEALGIKIEQVGGTTHVYKNETLIGSFAIDVEKWTLKFTFPDNTVFNYFAYIASDRGVNRLQWVNENLKSGAMDQLQAGVAFLGFARFEEEMIKHEGMERDHATSH